MSNELTSSQRAQLRGMAMRLKPVLSIGKQGLTETALKELELALKRDELVKVRVAAPDREVRAALFEDIASRSGAALCGAIGGTASFYRPSPERKIELRVK
jgi:RNA-binding protein